MEPEEILFEISKRVDATIESGEELNDDLIAFIDTTYALIAQMYAIVHKKESN